ncbi:MAG: iron ABC transporter permease [Bacteroidota bacterium]
MQSLYLTKLNGTTDRMRNKIRHLYRDFNRWSLFTMTIGLFVAIPVFTILIYLFHGVGEMWQHIVKYFLADYILNSIYLILGTGVLSFVFGISTAWIVARYDFPFKKWIEWMLLLPLAIPSYIVAYAYVGLFDHGGTLIRCMQSIGISINKIDMMNIYGLIWVLSCSLFPYVYVSTKAMFLSLPREIRDASYLLGASNTKYFLRIALPLAYPAIIGGLFLVFMEVLNDYGAAKYYGINTFTTGIFRSWTMLEDLQSAIYLSALLVVLVFFVNGVVYWMRGSKSYSFRANSNQQNIRNRTRLTGGKKVGFIAIVVAPVLFGFILPLIQLLYWGMLTFENMFTMKLITIALESIVLALITTFFIVLAALILIFFSKWNHLKGIKWFKNIGILGYVIPGAIIGIGIIRSSQAIINFFDRNLNLEIGYLFYGSAVILIYAYVFRFLAVAYNPLESNTLKIGKELAESSYLLGIRKFKTLVKIELPMLRNAMIGAGFLVMIDIMKELPLTLILKPYTLNTLAVKAYEYADDERVAEAALPALILIVIIVIMMIIVQSLNARSINTERNENA